MDAKLLILMETTKQKFGYLNQDHNCEAAKKEMAAFFGALFQGYLKEILLLNLTLEVR